MNLLIAVASRHGSTREIADRLAERLELASNSVTIVDVDDWNGDPGQYDAVIVGSAVYEGHWLRSARHFLDRHGATLRQRPVWMFSSGPIGDDRIGVNADHLAELCEAINPVGYHQFGGKLDRADLGRLERWIVDVVRAQEGDFRDWDDVAEWADAVAKWLTTSDAESTT